MAQLDIILRKIPLKINNINRKVTRYISHITSEEYKNGGRFFLNVPF